MSRYTAARAALLTVVLALAVFAAYEIFEQPGNQLFGKTLTRGPSNERVVALTFDDGPNPPYTDRILDVLESERAPATFFVVGRAVHEYPADVEREVRDGDAVGNHTWDHGHLIVISQDGIMRSLRRTDDAIYAASGVHPKLMRPPFGARDWSVMQAAERLGYTVVMWSEPLPRDWEYPPAATIADRVLQRVEDGSIIVLHDGNRGLLCTRQHLPPRTCDRSADIAATRMIVQNLRRRGFRFVTIPELISLGKAQAYTRPRHSM